MPALQAETPPDTLVMANQIDDMITLDPAEVFEFTAAEYAANVYDRLVTYPPDDVENLQGHVAESWQIADDGKTYTFKVRDGITFHSGNPLTAEDAVFSLQRVIKLNKTPAFILNQFGFTPENVEQQIQVVDDRTFTVVLDQPYAPTFFLYCLTATVGSVVDKQEVLAHEQDGDLGYEWLKTASAGSGPFKLRSWKANESLTLDAQPRLLGRGAGLRAGDHPAHRRAREPDAAAARRATSTSRATSRRTSSRACATAPRSTSSEVPKGAIYYLGLNQKNEYLAKPEVREALKWLVDYDGIANSIVKGSAVVHQAFLPQGFLGAIDDQPYTLERRRRPRSCCSRPASRTASRSRWTPATPRPCRRSRRCCRPTGPRPGSRSRSCRATTSRR